MATYPTLAPHLRPWRGPGNRLYVEAFGAEIARFVMPDGVVAHAELRLGDALSTLGEAVQEY